MGAAGSGPRHRFYTPEIAETILERLADGETLRGICSDAGMPTEGAVRFWVTSDREGFATRYAQAREAGCWGMADEILELSDDAVRDVKVDAEGRETVDYEVVARSRLRVDTRKFLLSKLIPKTFGDKSAVEVSGSLSITGELDTIASKVFGGG